MGAQFSRPAYGGEGQSAPGIWVHFWSRAGARVGGEGLVLWWQRWYSRLYHYWIGSDAVTSISNIVVVSVAVRGDIIMIAIVVG